MSQPRDVASKGLADHDPEAFVRMILRHLGREVQGEIVTIDSDLKTANLTADRIFRIDELIPWLLVVESLGYRDPQILPRMDCYNAYAGYKYQLPAWTVLVLLTPKAELGDLITGYFERTLPWQAQHLLPYRVFRFQVIRLWQIPWEEWLKGPTSMLPFALLGQYPDEKVGEVVSRIAKRIHEDVSAADEIKLRTLALLLIGVRFPPEVIAKMFPDLSQLRESSTYKMIRDEGRVEGLEVGRTEQAFKMLLKAGGRRFGEASSEVRTDLAQIHDATILELLFERHWDVESWDALLRLIPQKTGSDQSL
jgi:predicted transposase YdaD